MILHIIYKLLEESLFLLVWNFERECRKLLNTLGLLAAIQTLESRY